MKTNKLNVQKLLLAMAVALPLFAVTGASGANEVDDHFPGMPPGGPGGAPVMVGRPLLLRGVELSEAQDDKVFAILHEEQPYLREQGKAAAKAQEALRELAAADKYDDAKAASLAQAAATAMANISLQRARTEQKLLAVLTPEQRKQLDADRDGKGKPRRSRS